MPFTAISVSLSSERQRLVVDGGMTLTSDPVSTRKRYYRLRVGPATPVAASVRPPEFPQLQGSLHFWAASPNLAWYGSLGEFGVAGLLGYLGKPDFQISRPEGQ